MFPNTRLHLRLSGIVLLLTAWLACGAQYRIVSLTPNEAAITWTFDRDDCYGPDTASSFIFGVTAQPSVACRITVQQAPDAPFSQREASLRTSGWAGNTYIHWYAVPFSARAPSAGKSAAPYTCTMKLTFSQPIIASENRALPMARHYPVVTLPLTRLPTQRPAVTKPFIPYTTGVRIEISKDGIYTVRGSKLQALGVPIASIALRSYRLYCKDREIPLAVSNPDHALLSDADYISFYGTMLHDERFYFTQYSYTNVYWLTWDNTGPGLRVAEASGWPEKDPFIISQSTQNIQPLIATEFRDTLHLEVDGDIRWMGDIFNVVEAQQGPDIDTLDNWYWYVLGFNKLTTVPFSIPSPFQNSFQDVRLRVRLTGLTSLTSIPLDHRFSIQLNNKSLDPGIAAWDGQTDFIFTNNFIENSKISHGDNTISFLRLQDDSIPDRAALNWIEFDYMRGYKALGNKIYFKNSPKYFNRRIQYTLRDFTSQKLELWDISSYRMFKHFVVQKMGMNDYSLAFQDSVGSGTRYYAQAESLRLDPDYMALDTISDNWEYPGGIDYAVITADSLIPVLQPLVAYHRQSGLTVEVIELQDIYNRFSYGIHDPESIRSMIAYLFSSHAANPPRYLLLAGNASHDMDKKGGYKNIVPTHLTRIPSWGPASCDDYFVTVNGSDNFPDMYVGRLPADNLKQMAIMVAKTVRYLSYPDYGYWRDNILIAGGLEAEFTAFNNEAMATLIGPDMNISRMDANINSPFYVSGSEASNKMAGYINAGTYAINFLGHGGENVWSDSKFFKFSDLSKLHNSQWGNGGRLPIIFSFTCLTGFFESTLYQCLGEEFLRYSENGCITFYGASGYTKRRVDINMSRTLLKLAMKNAAQTVGELTYLTELLMLVTYGSEAIPLNRQYNVLGDPAVPWKLVPDSLKLLATNTNLSQTDSLKVAGTTAAITSGNVRISVQADKTSSWGEIIKPVTNGSFNHTFGLKQNVQTAQGLVRCYAWNDSTGLRGWIHFTKDTLSLFDVAITPQEPALLDSVTITCKTDLKDTIDIPVMTCRYTIDNPQNPSINFNPDAFVFMQKDSFSTIWTSRTRVPVGSDTTSFDMNRQLILKFFVLGPLGASDYFSFQLRGRPDLVFTSDTMRPEWKNDSIYARCEVLNKGNSQCPPFSIVFFRNNDTGSDTIFHTYTTAPLSPGKTARISFPIPDMQGTALYTGVVNGSHEINEVSFANNTTSFKMSVTFSDLATPADTIYSLYRGCRITPCTTLAAAHRVFLFQDTLKEKQPLASRSVWVPVRGDNYSWFRIKARPALSASDSLQWIFSFDTAVSRQLPPDTLAKPCVFLYDSASRQWVYSGGGYDTLSNRVTMRTTVKGPCAVGKFFDNTPPEIRVFISGKEIAFLDYAAKDKPFNIFITDSSGVSISSIKLFLNNVPLEKEYKSDGSTGNNQACVIVTAYPQKMNLIDSLTVMAEDNAGNKAIKTFAYRPGEKLSIRFFSCHPNPFTAKPGKLVRFAYLLTDLATDVSLTIYTISGRKVWTWENTGELIGYQEIAWDGTTLNQRMLNQGYRIANGTYYAKLVVKNKDTKIHKIIRIAKLEGF